MHFLLHCSSYISHGTTLENLHTNQDILFLVIISIILMTCLCYNAVIWWGEIGCWSLLGLKELIWRQIITVETQYNEVPTDSEDVFVITGILYKTKLRYWTNLWGKDQNRPWSGSASTYFAINIKQCYIAPLSIWFKCCNYSFSVAFVYLKATLIRNTFIHRLQS